MERRSRIVRPLVLSNCPVSLYDPTKTLVGSCITNNNIPITPNNHSPRNSRRCWPCPKFKTSRCAGAQGEIAVCVGKHLHRRLHIAAIVAIELQGSELVIQQTCACAADGSGVRFQEIVGGADGVVRILLITGRCVDKLNCVGSSREGKGVAPK